MTVSPLPDDPERATLPAATTLARIHQLAGPHPSQWHTLRSFGPLPVGRFDQHDLPPGTDPSHSVLYAAGVREEVDLLTVCIAEAFQITKTVDLRLNAPQFTLFETQIPLSLLKVGHTTSDRLASQAWARRQCATAPPPHGVLYPSVRVQHLGRANNVCLWGPPANDAIPPFPLLSIPLADPAILGAIQTACAHLDYTLLI